MALTLVLTLNSTVCFHELLYHFNQLEAKPGQIVFSKMEKKHYFQCLHRRKMVTFLQGPAIPIGLLGQSTEELKLHVDVVHLGIKNMEFH